MCRRWSAGPFFAIECGATLKVEDPTQLGVYRSSEWAERCFCKQCGTPLFYRLVGKDFYAVSAEAFDDRGDFALTSSDFRRREAGLLRLRQQDEEHDGRGGVRRLRRVARSGQGLGDERSIRPAQFHHQLRPAASGGARRAAPGAGTRRRDRRARRSAHRPPASRHREADRAEDLSAGDPVFRPARLCRADEPGACVLPRGGKAARPARCRAARN